MMPGTSAHTLGAAINPVVLLAHVGRTVRLGFRSLWLHRLRSLLTVLGIVFGVCSVIAMLAVGEGASHEAQEQIRRLGSNNIIVRSLKPPEEQKASSTRSYVVEYGLTYADIRCIRATIPGITIVLPERIIRNYIWNGGRRVDCEIVGTVPWYPEMRGHDVAKGRFFTDSEMEANTNVCVLVDAVAAELFPIDEPIGRNVRAGSDCYHVIGIMQPEAARPQTAAGEQEKPGANSNAPGPAHRIYIPLSAAKNRFGETLIKRRSGSFEAERVELHEAIIKVARQENVIDTASVIADLLARNHKKKDYELIVPLELLRQAQRTKQIFNIVLGSIAAISLLVGGIGIMNIMLASVTERTREIGIRRALGAKRRDIVVQFLVETVILSGAGGLIGVALGMVIPFAITYFTRMVTIITPWSPLLAFSISGLVGVVFGLYPAFRAANMDPVEALRHE
jgi:putative ABC transport system permease protein